MVPSSRDLGTGECLSYFIVVVAQTKGVSTAKVWKDFQLVYNLKGHEGAVWAVLALEDDQYLTGESSTPIHPYLEQSS